MSGNRFGATDRAEVVKADFDADGFSANLISSQAPANLIGKFPHPAF